MTGILETFLLLAQTASPSLPMPTFLTGCWVMRSGARTAEECWTRGNAGLMIGSARTWTGEKIDNWEWMRIERGADGSLAFFAAPGGAPATRFAAVSATASEAIFENRVTDYPQRVRYWKTTRGIAAEISLADGSKPVRFDFLPLGGPPEPAN